MLRITRSSSHGFNNDRWVHARCWYVTPQESSFDARAGNVEHTDEIAAISFTCKFARDSHLPWMITDHHSVPSNVTRIVRALAPPQ
jgi:hypothetical protein